MWHFSVYCPIEKQFQLIPDKCQGLNIVIEYAICQVILPYLGEYCCCKWLFWWDLGECIGPPAAVKYPRGTFSESWSITLCFGHVPVWANGIRSFEVSFAVLIGSDPFLHFKELSALNIPILAERGGSPPFFGLIFGEYYDILYISKVVKGEFPHCACLSWEDFSVYK